MAARRTGTVVSAFHDHTSAGNALRALRDAGFGEHQIGVASTERGRTGTTEVDSDADATYAGEGAATGVAAGAGIGALWGLGILAGVMPVIGPAIAGGTLAVILSSAAAGAAAAGLAGSLIGMGISKEEAEFYEAEMKAGRTIITVDAGTRIDEARVLLRDHGGYDMTTRPTATDDFGGHRTIDVPVSRQTVHGDPATHDVLTRDVDVPRM